MKRWLQQGGVVALVYLSVATVFYNVFGVRAPLVYTLAAVFIGIAASELWPEARPVSWADRNIALLGSQVRVTLDRPQGEPAIVAEGKLLCFGDDGSLVLLQDDGFIHYTWPLLDIEQVK